MPRNNIFCMFNSRHEGICRGKSPRREHFRFHCHCHSCGKKVLKEQVSWRCRQGLITSFQHFGDNNTLVRYAHSCVIITKKLHSIPYDTVTHSNSVINPSISPLRVNSLYNITTPGWKYTYEIFTPAMKFPPLGVNILHQIFTLVHLGRYIMTLNFHLLTVKILYHYILTPFPWVKIL